MAGCLNTTTRPPCPKATWCLNHWRTSSLRLRKIRRWETFHGSCWWLLIILLDSSIKWCGWRAKARIPPTKRTSAPYDSFRPEVSHLNTSRSRMRTATLVPWSRSGSRHPDVSIGGFCGIVISVANRMFFTSKLPNGKLKIPYFFLLAVNAHI